MDTVVINDYQIAIKEYNGERVLSFNDIDLTLRRSEGASRRSFRNNRNFFEEGIDYYKVPADRFNEEVGQNEHLHSEITLLTKSGYIALTSCFKNDYCTWMVPRETLRKYFKDLKESISDNKVVDRQEEIVTDNSDVKKLTCEELATYLVYIDNAIKKQNTMLDRYEMMFCKLMGDNELIVNDSSLIKHCIQNQSQELEELKKLVSSISEKPKRDVVISKLSSMLMKSLICDESGLENIEKSLRKEE